MANKEKKVFFVFRFLRWLHSFTPWLSFGVILGIPFLLGMGFQERYQIFGHYWYDRWVKGVTPPCPKYYAQCITAEEFKATEQKVATVPDCRTEFSFVGFDGSSVGVQCNVLSGDTKCEVKRKFPE